MKFVWKYMPPSGGSGAEKVSGGPDLELGKTGSRDALEKASDRREFIKKREDLKDYYEALKNQNQNAAEKAKFEKQLSEWEQKGDVEAMRCAGMNEKADLADPNKRHVLLSSAFLTSSASETEGKHTFKVDFKGNKQANWKIGAADLLPTNAIAIAVRKAPGNEGFACARAVRRINPTTGRIGYFDEAKLKEGMYEYVPVFSGDEIEILETGTMPPIGNTQSLRENVEIYRRGAMKDSASEAIERRYNPQTKTVAPAAGSQETRHNEVQSKTALDLAALRRTVTSQAGKSAPGEIAHHYSKDLTVMTADHAANFQHLEIDSKTQHRLEKFRDKVMPNRERYEKVAIVTHIPWFLIASLHERESGCNFNTYLHNGDPLGKPTVHVPVGKLFYDWESSAIDALKSAENNRVQLGIDENTTDMSKLMSFAERYNGVGYRGSGKGPSPYVYAGTNIYQGGKYVADGVYDPNAIDKQLGVAPMLQALNEPNFGPQKKNEAVA